MDIDALSDFRLVALHKGFGHAARASDRPKSSISKHVRQLESELGVRLFDRTSRSIRLTEEGEKLSVLAEHLIYAVNEFRDDISDKMSHPAGRLRVAGPSLFAYLWAGQLTARFLLQYPQIELELVISDRMPDISDDFYDVVVQVNPPETLDFVGRIIARDSTRIVVSPAFADGLADRLEAAPDMAVAAVAQVATKSIGPWTIRLDEKSYRLQPDIQVYLPSRIMIRDAVTAGFGFAELPASLVRDQIESGALIDLGPAPIPSVEIWALYPSRRLLSPRVSKFVSFLSTYFKSTTIAP